jgi:hypothetical protein
MNERARVSHLKPKETEQGHRARHQEAQPSFDKFLGWDQGLLSLTETPFYPRVDEHAAFLASAPPGPPLTNFVMRLQRTYGNRYVQRLMQSMRVQAKFTVNPPNDVYEQEADRVADAVTGAVTSQTQRQEEEEEIQMQPAESESATVSEELETSINNAKGTGQPLSDIVREPMERAIGADFSGVRVHTDSEADVLNQQLNARAFTTGQDIFFREGEYSPGSGSGQKLIAHELTHVVQQGGARVDAKHNESPTLSEKTLEGEKGNLIGIVEEKSPDTWVERNDDGPSGGVIQRDGKKAGVESFKVEWTKNARAGAKTAKLRLDYTAKFKKDDAHDPALAEFRQNAMTKYEITDGPHKGTRGDTSPLHDDNYSRADDLRGHSKSDVDFYSNDNPGFTYDSLDANDVVDYSFTAEQMIIDTSDGDKEIAKRGPYTAKITGKHERAYPDVPKTFS